MAVEFFAEDVELPNIDLERVQSWITNVVQKDSELQVGDITIIFVSDEYLLEMNNQYLEHDYFTDIITFDYSEEKIISGDLFISIDTVLSNSQEFNVSFMDELHRVIIHGVLHLMGYKDKTDEESAIMTQMENNSLSIF